MLGRRLGSRSGSRSGSKQLRQPAKLQPHVFFMGKILNIKRVWQRVTGTKIALSFAFSLPPPTLLHSDRVMELRPQQSTVTVRE